MSNVSRGFAYEREVKKHFTDGGWGCTRAAHSASAMDLIAFVKRDIAHLPAACVLQNQGYTHKMSKSTKIPLRYVAIKREKNHVKSVYYEVVIDDAWIVVLMQCKIRKR